MNPPFPPTADTIATPSDAPLHVEETSTASQISGSGSVIVTVQDVTHPFASVTDTVCNPAVKLTAVAVVSPLSHA